MASPEKERLLVYYFRTTCLCWRPCAPGLHVSVPHLPKSICVMFQLFWQWEDSRTYWFEIPRTETFHRIRCYVTKVDRDQGWSGGVIEGGSEGLWERFGATRRPRILCDHSLSHEGRVSPDMSAHSSRRPWMCTSCAEGRHKRNEMNMKWHPNVKRESQNGWCGDTKVKFFFFFQRKTISGLWMP